MAIEDLVEAAPLGVADHAPEPASGKCLGALEPGDPERKDDDRDDQRRDERGQRPLVQLHRAGAYVSAIVDVPWPRSIACARARAGRSRPRAARPRPGRRASSAKALGRRFAQGGSSPGAAPRGRRAPPRPPSGRPPPRPPPTPTPPSPPSRAP